MSIHVSNIPGCMQLIGTSGSSSLRGTTPRPTHAWRAPPASQSSSSTSAVGSCTASVSGWACHDGAPTGACMTGSLRGVEVPVWSVTPATVTSQ